jgi:hypothetical protein
VGVADPRCQGPLVAGLRQLRDQQEVVAAVHHVYARISQD